MNNSRPIGIISRYIFVLILGSIGFSLFYIVFTPLTFYPSFLLLKIFYSAQALPQSATIILLGHQIRLIEACIAGSAYFLLFMLNLLTPMQLNMRIKSLFYLCFTFLFINIIRIFIFTSLYASDFEYFDVFHRAIWYFGSTFMVVFIWFSNVYLFKIKSIPAYTDFKYIYKQIYIKK
jgi:hypothetical protein